MAEPAPRGIQATLFDYFQDTEYFSIEDAKELVVDQQNRDVNRESIRARIYEGIDKGLFERVGKGLYTVTRKDEQGRENTCLLINGDGRDLSMLPDNSVDAIVTDHPYDISKSLKGGNRNFANYEMFRYTEQDFREKLRVLKPGCFLVEFLPEENADNYQYLFQVKELARKAGFEYYAKVPWQKGDRFVANTGRKSKNTEDICFFSKGRARDLRPNAQKDKAYQASREIVEFKEHIPGSKTVHAYEIDSTGTSYQTEVEAIDVNIRLSVDKKDVPYAQELLEQAWYNAVQYSFDASPLDKENGGEYTWEELDGMPVQDYILKYLEKTDLKFVDLSPGPEDIFKSGNDVIVNPTNLIGPMGAGLAKEFRDRYPGLEETYKESCRQRQFTGSKGFKSTSFGGDEIISAESRAMFEGDLFFFGAPGSTNGPHVLCFPTKRDWKDPSSLDLIEAGLKTFVRNYKHFNIKSITFPKLGCGLGGLNWEKEVKPLMQKYLSGLKDIDIRICGDTLRQDKEPHYMSGAAGMLPTVFNVAPPKSKIHQAEKPVDLLMQILCFVTKEGELALDQFAGSGVLGEAALKTGRDSILIEKDTESYDKMCARIEALGNVEVLDETQREAINVAVDALEAAYEGPDSIEAFAAYQNQHGMSLGDAADIIEGMQISSDTTEEQEALQAASQAVEQSKLANCLSKDTMSEQHAGASAGAQNTSEENSESVEISGSNLTTLLTEWMEKGVISVAPHTWSFGCVDLSIDSKGKLNPNKFEISVREDDWNDSQYEAVAREMVKAISVAQTLQFVHPEEIKQQSVEAPQMPEQPSEGGGHPRVLECSSRGDKRFSALYAKVTINGKEKSIEEWYQNAKRTPDGRKAGKGKPFTYIVDPYTGDKFPSKEASWLYRGLWIAYLKKNPDLVEYASQFDQFHDSFRTEKTFNCQAEVIEAYVKGNRDFYVETVQASDWYRNLVRHKNKVKAARAGQAPLDERIQNAKEREKDSIDGEQISLSLPGRRIR